MPTKKTNKTDLLKRALKKLQKDIANVLALLETGSKKIDFSEEYVKQAKQIGKEFQEGESKIIEGVFTGEEMVGPDGKHYSVPTNYASKSKLVEGDILKLTILPDGKFLYKQIGPRERIRLRGILIKDDETNDFYVLGEGRFYKVLLASVTYFKGSAGDEAIIIVPKSKNSKWAAIENIIKKGPGISMDEAIDKAVEEGDVSIIKEEEPFEFSNFEIEPEITEE